MLDEQIVEIEFLDNVLVDCGSVKEIYEVLDEVTGSRRVKKLLVIGKHTEITKDARLLIVQENKLRRDLIAAEAIVVHSFAQKLSANFYIMFLTNIYPVQFFNQRDKAEQWLHNS